MAYNEKISDRIREVLVRFPGVDPEMIEEKHMFGGICYLLNGKMCMGVVKDEIMCRIDPELEDEALTRRGCRPMDFTGKPMKGYVFVEEEGFRSDRELEYWIALCVRFNANAKASSKGKRKKKQ